MPASFSLEVSNIRASASSAPLLIALQERQMPAMLASILYIFGVLYCLGFSSRVCAAVAAQDPTSFKLPRSTNYCEPPYSGTGEINKTGLAKFGFRDSTGFYRQIAIVGLDFLVGCVVRASTNNQCGSLVYRCAVVNVFHLYTYDF